MTRRLAVAVAALATALAVPAHAAPKPVCLQVVDVAGDGTFAGSNHDALDVLSADIATGKRNLVAAIRLKSVATDPALATGVTYTYDFSLGGVPHTLSYKRYATGESVSTISFGTGFDITTDNADAVLDASTATLTWTVARRVVTGLKKAGAKVSQMNVEAAFSTNLTWPGGSYAASTPVDTASSGKTYADMTPTCLKGT